LSKIASIQGALQPGALREIALKLSLMRSISQEIEVKALSAADTDVVDGLTRLH
jgi:hypothetical protein